MAQSLFSIKIMPPFSKTKFSSDRRECSNKTHFDLEDVVFDCKRIKLVHRSVSFDTRSVLFDWKVPSLS